MTTAADTNIFVALWNPDDSLNSLARVGLRDALHEGSLVIAAPVYAELLAAPGRDEQVIERFIRETGIAVDWVIDEKIWREAGRAYRDYVTVRRRQREIAPRRILADFVIGAHAVVRKHRLLTLDAKVFRSAFPSLDVISI
jgi:hypothetical protein